MRGRPSLLLGLIALVLAAFGPLVTGAPARAASAPHAMAGMARAGMPADCPMHRHAGKTGHADEIPAVCAGCCGQVAAEAPLAVGPSAPSVARRPMAPAAELTGGPGRSIPPALGPPRAAV